MQAKWSLCPPTPSTVLAVDPVNLPSVDRIYDLKTRARHKPLSLLIADTAQAYELARDFDTAFDRLAEKFWPGRLRSSSRPAASCRCALQPTPATSRCAFQRPKSAAPWSASLAADYGYFREPERRPECTYAGCVRDQFGYRFRSSLMAPYGSLHCDDDRRPQRRRQLVDDRSRRRDTDARNRARTAALTKRSG